MSSFWGQEKLNRKNGMEECKKENPGYGGKKMEAKRGVGKW